MVVWMYFTSSPVSAGAPRGHEVGTGKLRRFTATHVCGMASGTPGLIGRTSELGLLHRLGNQDDVRRE
jgi:hypothetical protein